MNDHIIEDCTNAIINRFGDFNLNHLFFDTIEVAGCQPWSYFDEAAHRYYNITQGSALTDAQIQHVIDLFVATASARR